MAFAIRSAPYLAATAPLRSLVLLITTDIMIYICCKGVKTERFLMELFIQINKKLYILGIVSCYKVSVPPVLQYIYMYIHLVWDWKYPLWRALLWQYPSKTRTLSRWSSFVYIIFHRFFNRKWFQREVAPSWCWLKLIASTTHVSAPMPTHVLLRNIIFIRARETPFNIKGSSLNIFFCCVALTVHVAALATWECEAEEFWGVKKRCGHNSRLCPQAFCLVCNVCFLNSKKE